MALVLGLAPGLFVIAGGSSSADVATTTGSAFGARGSISLFGGPPITLAPTPSVTLPSAGGSQSDSATSAMLQAGPARVVRTGMLRVATQGTTGSAGAVTSSATVTDPSVAGLNATEAASTCRASEAGFTGSTTITSGTLFTKRDVTTGDPTTTVDLPASPPPNDTYNGTVDNVGDSFKVVLNEQIVTADAITVNAVHFYLLGPTAVGDLFVGQSVCGLTAVAGSTASTSTTTSSSSTTSTSSSTSKSSSTSTISSTTSTTTSSAPATVSATTPNAGTPGLGSGGGTTSSTRAVLATTGAGPDLTALAAVILAIGTLLFIGSSGEAAPSGTAGKLTSASGSSPERGLRGKTRRRLPRCLTMSTTDRRRGRRPWDHHRWW